MKFDFGYVRRAGRNIRIHGNGFVQIDLLDRPGERVHLFGHPDIPRQASPTPIHDHRFGFESTILSGYLVNVGWDVLPEGNPTHVVCGYEPGIGEDTKLIPTAERVRVLPRTPHILRPGQSYEVYPGELHETFANEATITRMRKTETADIRPRVLCRIGMEPDNSFDRHQMMKEDDIWECVFDAFITGGLPL